MRHTLTRILGATALTACALLTVGAPAHAAPIPPPSPGGGTTMGDLEDRGFTCGRIGIGGYMCTKGGETWYCDNTKKCEKALITTKPAPTRVVTSPVTSTQPQLLDR